MDEQDGGFLLPSVGVLFMIAGIIKAVLETSYLYGPWDVWMVRPINSGEIIAVILVVVVF